MNDNTLTPTLEQRLGRPAPRPFDPETDGTWVVWKSALRCALYRAEVTGIRQRVYRARLSSWGTTWVVQDAA